MIVDRRRCDCCRRRMRSGESWSEWESHEEPATDYYDYGYAVDGDVVLVWTCPECSDPDPVEEPVE